MPDPLEWVTANVSLEPLLVINPRPDISKVTVGLAVPMPTLLLVESTNSVFESTLIPDKYLMAIFSSVSYSTNLSKKRG
jgi:hypothetical protein